MEPPQERVKGSWKTYLVTLQNGKDGWICLYSYKSLNFLSEGIPASNVVTLVCLKGCNVAQILYSGIVYVSALTNFDTIISNNFKTSQV